MQSIMYRGKIDGETTHKDNWVTGCLEYDADCHTYYIKFYEYYTNEEGFQRDYRTEIVYTNTICQLVETVNGQYYFENDIIQYKCESENIDGFSNPTEFVKAVILYDKEKYCWSFGYPNPQGEIEEIYPIYEMIDHIDGKIKVIGNIFDNADLLKSE